MAINVPNDLQYTLAHRVRYLVSLLHPEIHYLYLWGCWCPVSLTYVPVDQKNLGTRLHTSGVVGVHRLSRAGISQVASLATVEASHVVLPSDLSSRIGHHSTQMMGPVR